MMTLIASVVGMCLIITVGILLLFSFMLVYKKFTQAYHQYVAIIPEIINLFIIHNILYIYTGEVD